MELLTPGGLKVILHSKRANLYCREHCRNFDGGGCVEHVPDKWEHSVCLVQKKINFKP